MLFTLYSPPKVVQLRFISASPSAEWLAHSHVERLRPFPWHLQIGFPKWMKTRPTYLLVGGFNHLEKY